MVSKTSIKAIIRHLIDRVGGTKAAAMICDSPKSDVSYWSADHHDRFIPIDHLVSLDAEAGDLFLKEWARSRGFDLVPRASRPDEAACVVRIMGGFAKEAGELGAVVLDAVEDNHLTDTEKRLIRDNIAPVKDQIQALERAIGG